MGLSGCTGKKESAGNVTNTRHIYSKTLISSGWPVSTCRRSVSLRPTKPTITQVKPNDIKSMPVDFMTILPVTPAITKRAPITIVVIHCPNEKRFLLKTFVMYCPASLIAKSLIPADVFANTGSRYSLKNVLFPGIAMV